MTVIVDGSLGITSPAPSVLQGSTSGSVSLTVPAVAGSNTITLPAGTGTAAVQGVSTNIVSGTAQSSGSGTSIDFTSIPSWVKRVTVMFNQVSTNGSSAVILQIGSSGGVENTGYVGCGHNGPNAAVSFTTGFPCVVATTAAFTYNGTAVISTLGSNVWAGNAMLGASSTGNAQFGGASKTLSGILDRIRITTVNGTDTFDSGSINILWE